MASFYGLSFCFDGVSSEDFGLYIGEFSSNSITNGCASNNSDFVQDTINGRTPFIYNVVQTDINLEFELNIFSYNPMSRCDITYVDYWLFNNNKPKKLVIYQEDMNNYHYECIFKKNEIINHANVPIGFCCKVICTSAYANMLKKTDSYTISGHTSIKFKNESDYFGYLYPKISFTCNRDNGGISIINKKDNNRTFIITGLKQGEVITIDEYFQMESSLGLFRSENCNKRWVRFVKGINELEVIGDTGKLYITYQFKKAIGG